MEINIPHKGLNLCVMKNAKTNSNGQYKPITLKISELTCSKNVKAENICFFFQGIPKWINDRIN